MPPIVDFNFTNSQRPQPRQLFRASDGDTPVIEQPVRMVSCDTPEKSGYAGKPLVSQPKLDTCRQRLESNFYNAIPQPMRQYFIERLTADAAEKHIAAGEEASAVFDSMLETRLTRPTGTKRPVAIIATGEIIDIYGRLLAYMAPWYNNTPSDPLPPLGDPARNTFNLDMIANGWAAFFPVYPSLPKDVDMNLAIAAAEAAWDDERGVWGEFGTTFLVGYEYRACVKLGVAATADDGIAQAFQRVCVDLRNLQIVGKFGYHAVPPPYRLWIWEDDLAAATVRLELVS
jgi:endonuclease YncB( thermonuclease family)